MITSGVTQAMKNEIAGKHRIRAKVTIMLNDDPTSPTNLTIESDRLMAGGVTLNDGTSSPGSFDIGAAIINQCTVLLDNSDGAYSSYNFEGAVATVFAGIPTNAAGTLVTWFRKGTYILSDPTTTPAVITLKGVDFMAKFDKEYDGNLSFTSAKTLRQIVQHCCTQCGVTLLDSYFNNYSYSIQSDPFAGQSVTYRQVLSYCAQLACCYARCDAQGRLALKWYNTAAFDSGNESQRHSVTKFSQGPTVSTEDVVITGVRVTARDAADGAEGESYLYGNVGYVLEIKDNPMVAYGTAQTVAGLVGPSVVGMRFRPGSASFYGDPTMEAGDAALLTDRKNNQYRAYVTNLTYSFGGFASFTCDAVPALRKSADRYSRLAATAAKLRQETVKQIDSYIAAQARLDTLAFNALGFFKTVEEQQDGSIIEYAHDAPTLADSTIIYKKSIDGFFISRNGGVSYTNGFDNQGNAVLNILYAIGLDVSWIKAGTIGSQDGSVSIDFANQTITLNGSATFFSNYLQASDVGANGSTTIDGGRITTGQIKDSGSNTVLDLATGEFTMKKGTIQLGSSSADYLKIDNSGNLTSVRDNYKLLMNSGYLQGFIGNVKYGVLDLCIMDADNNNAKTVVLESGKNLVLDAATKIELAIGSTGRLAGGAFGTSGYMRHPMLTVTLNGVEINDSNGNVVLSSMPDAVSNAAQFRIAKNVVKIQNSSGVDALTTNSNGINYIKTGGDTGLTQTFYIYEGRVNGDGVLVPIYTDRTKLVFKNGILTSIQ